MPHSRPTPTRVLPSDPSIPRLRKQAKELLRSYRAGDESAIAEFARFERRPDPAAFALADAQRVLARAYGFGSWTRLSEHVAGVTVVAFCDAADAGDVAVVQTLAKRRPELVNADRGDAFGERIALHFAVLSRDTAMTRTLMRLGSDARRGFWPHRGATTAHTLAAERGYDEIVRIIEREEGHRRRAMSAPGAPVGAEIDAVLTAIRQERREEAILRSWARATCAARRRSTSPPRRTTQGWSRGCWNAERAPTPRRASTLPRTPRDRMLRG